MPQVFESAVRQAKANEILFKQNDWVEIGRGVYKGDIARVGSLN